MVVLFCACLGLSAAIACPRHRSTADDTQAAQHASRSLPDLHKLIRLPAEPREAWFEERPIGQHPGGFGPTDYVFMAVLRFDRETLAKALKDAVPLGEESTGLVSIENRPWFPPAVTAAIQPGDANKSFVLGRRFQPGLFNDGRFTFGHFTVLDGGEYVILVLQTS